jgi:hypothetical protein
VRAVLGAHSGIRARQNKTWRRRLLAAHLVFARLLYSTHAANMELTPYGLHAILSTCNGSSR